jgi:hypothetical protein
MNQTEKLLKELLKEVKELKKAIEELPRKLSIEKYIQKVLYEEKKKDS